MFLIKIIVLATFYLRPATRITLNKARLTYLYPTGLAHELKGNPLVAEAEILRQTIYYPPHLVLSHN